MDEPHCPLCGEPIAFEARTCAACGTLPCRLYVGATVGQLAEAFEGRQRGGLIVGGSGPNVEGKAPAPRYAWKLWPAASPRRQRFYR